MLLLADTAAIAPSDPTDENCYLGGLEECLLEDILS